MCLEFQDLMNRKNLMNRLDLLEKIPNETIKIAFFDPQYRWVLDKLWYGNEWKQRWKIRSALPQMSEEIIENFIIKIEEKLLPSGYLFLWVDKFHLVEWVKNWFEKTPNFSIVDMITWDKQKIGMGYRTRRRSEYLIIVQKEPKKAKTTWTLHNIPDVWVEKLTSKPHTHSKPIELQKQLILATTSENDIVLDPASGGFSVLEACKQTGRSFIWSDLIFWDHE